MPWKKMLAWAAGQIEPLLLQKIEFVLEENRPDEFFDCTASVIKCHN
jgi:hypothetical protein